MKCPVCDSVVGADVLECPECGDHLGQWIEMDGAARDLQKGAALAARRGEDLKAVLRLTEVCVLTPDEPANLRALAEVLARHGDYEDAECYLNRGLSLAERTNADEERQRIEEALARVKALAERASGRTLLGLPIVPKALSQTAPTAQDEPTSLWRLATEVDRHWTDKLMVLRPVLEQLSPGEKQQEGPYAYLKGLFALAEGDADAAADCFRQSIEADASQRNADAYLLCISAEAERVESAVEFLLDHDRTCEDVMCTALWIAEESAKGGSVSEYATLLSKTAEQIEASTQAHSAVTTYLLGRAYVDLGRMSDARKHLTGALERDPEYSPAKELLDELADPETGESEDRTLE